MNVLIVARTRMGDNRRCIGGVAENGRSVRLLTRNGENFDTHSAFQVGGVWALDLRRPASVVKPHVEDMLVFNQQFINSQSNLGAHLLERVAVWRGSICQLFDGLVQYTASNNGYVCERVGVPDRSTGFWIPDEDLYLRADGKHYDYQYQGLSYVGEDATRGTIPADTLVRVSLARWWKPEGADIDFEERCYLQLSSWYT